jgi:hypothetical protein
VHLNALLLYLPLTAFLPRFKTPKTGNE